MRRIAMFSTILITSLVMALAGLVASPIASASVQDESISATFAPGSSVLTKAQKAAIKKALASSGTEVAYTVTGTAGKLPGVTDSKVKRLAKARANAIKAYLVSLGVSKTLTAIRVKLTEIGQFPRSTGRYPTSASTVAATNSAGTGSGSSSGGGSGSSSGGVISVAAIAGVTAPVSGATPVTTTTAGTGYTGTVSWSPNHSPFQSGTIYTATISVTPTSGYTLTGVAANFFTVAGATSVTHSADSGVITAVFPTTATTISPGAIAGVTRPVTGATPVTTTTAGTGYTGTVTWSGSPATFASATTYTATITLTPTSGYTLVGVCGSCAYFSVSGASPVTNSENSGVITAVFPATATTISVAAIAGVTAPVAGATRVTTTTAGTGYTGTVTWSPSAGTTFASVTTYTATITLTPTSGYTLAGVTANFFTVAGASPVTNSENSGVITAVFPATATGYLVGERGPGGGIVFYVSAASFASPGSTCNTSGAGGISECKYLEVAPATWQDTETTINPIYTTVADDLTYMWSVLGRATTQDITTASTEGILANSAIEKLNWKIGQGFYNTSLMNTSTTSAAQAAVLLYAGNSTAGQWFIPSMNELNELCKYARGQTTGNLTVACTSGGTLKTGTTDDLGGFVAVSYASSSEASTTNAYFRNFSTGSHSSISKSSVPRQIRPIRAF